VLDRQHLDRIDLGELAVNCKTIQKSDLVVVSVLGATPSSFLTSHNEEPRSGARRRSALSKVVLARRLPTAYFSDGPDRCR
jgi:hypothetical protein